MPIYEYLCNKCQQVSEVMQKFSDKPLSKCPLCGGKVKKLMSHNAFHLKGSGWYATDNRKSTAGCDVSSSCSCDSSCCAAADSSSASSTD